MTHNQCYMSALSQIIFWLFVLLYCNSVYYQLKHSSYINQMFPLHKLSLQTTHCLHVSRDCCCRLWSLPTVKYLNKKTHSCVVYFNRTWQLIVKLQLTDRQTNKRTKAKTTSSLYFAHMSAAGLKIYAAGIKVWSKTITKMTLQ